MKLSKLFVSPLGLSVLLFSGSAPAGASHWTACPKGANLIGDFADQHELAMRFKKTFPLHAGESTTRVKHSGKWRKYWGTALFATFSHEVNASLPEGSILRIRSAANDGGHMPVKHPHSFEDLYSSSAVIFDVPGREHGIYFLTLNGQPYSDIHVRRMERLLPVTLLCAPLGTLENP